MIGAFAFLLLFIVVLTALAPPLGWAMGALFEGRLPRALAKPERWLYRLAGVNEDVPMRWQAYLSAVLSFNFVGLLVVYAIERLQGVLPLNPTGRPGVEPLVAFNTAVSFASNTNWQAYAGETTMSHLTQMVALTTQNFVSAATGIAVLLALVRGLRANGSGTLGNFWVDLTRATLYVLLPLSLMFAVVLVSQGVVQTFSAEAVVDLLEPVATSGGLVTQQHLALGPVASQVAIKQLGTNGGGFFNVNSAHPFENPTWWTNALELLAILLLPAALCFSFGRLVGDSRQGRALYASMLVLFAPIAAVTIWAEHQPSPALTDERIDVAGNELIASGNLEGKEVRFGAGPSALWAVATTAASNGSIDSMHDSFTALGGVGPMWLMQLGEVVFGGVGSGLYGLIVYALLAVFIAGQMVGRTPEYLGKKLGAFEIKMASLAVLFPTIATLGGAALACVVPEGTSAIGNPGIHGFSEILYAFSSGANNNGSAFAGLTVSGPFYAVAIGVVMLVGRYWVIVAVLALAGALATRKQVPVTSGTLPTDGPLFVGLLSSVVILVGALTFLPALALGPIAEHLAR